MPVRLILRVGCLIYVVGCMKICACIAGVAWIWFWHVGELVSGLVAQNESSCLSEELSPEREQL